MREKLQRRIHAWNQLGNIRSDGYRKRPTGYRCPGSPKRPG